MAVAARQPLPARWPTAYAIALVRRGVVIRQRLDRNGRGVAIDAVGVGAGFVVERGARESTASGYAATDSLVCLYPRALVETQPADAGEAADLFAIARSSIQRAERIADARGRGTAMEKVAALLSALADELGARPRELVPSALTQRDLAALLAMRHESVCRVLRKLERDGTIRRDEDGIHLVDRERLCASGPSDSR